MWKINYLPMASLQIKNKHEDLNCFDGTAAYIVTHFSLFEMSLGSSKRNLQGSDSKAGSAS